MSDAEAVRKKRRRGLPTRVSNHGRIQNNSGLRYFPRPGGLGYCSIRLKTTDRRSVSVYVHRGVHILFHDPDLKLWRPGMTIDHIDGDRSNNHHTNHRWASKALQRHNTKPRTVCQYPSQRVRIFKAGESHEFESVTRAAEYIGCLSSQFSRQKIVHGWSVEYLEDPNLDGEEWRPFESGSGMVSSLGRVCTHGSKRFLVPHEDGYCWYGVGVPISHVILTSFGFPRPSKAHTADHIDRNRSNNALKNLRWATKSEQAMNRSEPRLRPLQRVEVKPVSGGEWRLYENTIEVRNALGISCVSANNCLNPATRTRTAAGNGGVRYKLRRVIDPSQLDMDGEEWKDLNLEDWDVGGKYYRLDEENNADWSDDDETEMVPSEHNDEQPYERSESPTMQRLVDQGRWNAEFECVV